MSPRSSAILAGLVAVPVSLAASSVGRAQPAHDPVAAEALFDEARRLMQDGRYPEACPKLEASQRLDPGVGTLLNLGHCLEMSGRTASAWAAFREAASASVATHQEERETLARSSVAALEPRLCRLVLRPPKDRTGLIVERDGSPFDPALFGAAVPVDPGDHVVTVRAEGKRPWTGAIRLEPGACEGSERVVEVPELQDAPPPLPLAPEASTAPPTGSATTRWGPQRAVALVAGALGVVAVAAGTVLAIDASSTYRDAKALCTADGCGPDAQRLSHDAGTRADFATVAFAVGAAGLVVGAVLWLLAPARPTATTLSLGPPVERTGVGVTGLSGAF